MPLPTTLKALCALTKPLLLVCLFSALPTANAWTLPAWLTTTLPNPGSGSIQDEIKCYSLPYGGLGFISHCITYWTFLWLGASRSPWALRRLGEWKMDLCLGVLSILATIATSALAIVRCRSTWPLLLIATWKMLLGFSLGCCTIHRALDVRRQQREWRDHLSASKSMSMTDFSVTPLAWLIFYAPGVVIGLVGLISIIVQEWSTRSKAMEIIAAVFGGTILFTIVLFLIGGICTDGLGYGIWMALLAAIGMIGVLAALFSDWILAAIEVQGGGTWLGLPSQEIAWLYWTYFVAKRLPFFSF